MDRPAYVSGEWIVRYSDDPTPLPRVDARDFWSGGATPLAPDLIEHLYLVPERSLDLPFFQSIKGKEVYRHRNYYMDRAADVFPTSVDFRRQWGLYSEGKQLPGKFGPFTPEKKAGIDAPHAWGLHLGSASYVIAIIDTGLSPDAQELCGNLWETGAGVGRDFFTNGPVTSDATGHGTRMASIIGSPEAARTVGLNWLCKMMPLKVFTTDTRLQTRTSVDLVIRALEFAKQRKVRVSNNSYGAKKIEDAQALKDAIREIGAQEGGHLFVCAAGNTDDNLDKKPFYPASFGLDNMIVVTSSGPHAELGVGRGFGRKSVDLAAPGEEIWCRGDYDYGISGGTSFATAHVTGAAGLAWSFLEERGVRRSAREIKELMRKTVRKSKHFRRKVRWGGELELGKLLEAAAHEK